ncbi:MAG: fatty acid desaturase [Ilumatobacteraceae bacterium]
MSTPMIDHHLEPDPEPNHARRLDHVEWPTLAVIAGWMSATILVIAFHASMPWWTTVPALAVLGALHFSLQHEVIHGHPTPWRRLNIALVGVPLSLWCPYSAYRDSHLAHHDSDLTVPGVDPESYQVTADAWRAAGRIRRAVLRANRTLLGRLVVGPWLVVEASVRDAARSLTTSGCRRSWGFHVPIVLGVVLVVVGIAGLPWWEYLVGSVWGATSMTLLRSFAEHRFVEGSRSAVVATHGPLALVFLNNNLHHTHHARPDVAWYRLPDLHRELGSDEIARTGAGWYRSYFDVARRHLVRPFGTPVHPSEAAGALGG